MVDVSRVDETRVGLFEAGDPVQTHGGVEFVFHYCFWVVWLAFVVHYGGLIMGWDGMSCMWVNG